ncbi:MAG: hypothetical protein GF320_13990 [Armatimonadia bacterium]|nr:hypothetical protein [Armatimonadia bacterium]
MPQDDIPADMGEISEDFTDLMAEIMTKTTLVYVTEDSFEDVQAWAEENFADWTIGDVEEENGMKNMEISSDQHEGVRIAVGDTGDHRLILIGDESRAADAQAEMEQMVTEMMAGAMAGMEEAGEEAGAAMEEAGEAIEGAVAEGADAVEEGAADVEAAVEDEGTQ